MGNSNYQKGVRFEREVMKQWLEEKGASAGMRTAGSHGPFDVVVIHKDHPTFIQCKVTASRSTGELLIKRFREAPPLNPSAHFHQLLMVKILNDEILSVTV
jgi:hypothetical protein